MILFSGENLWKICHFWANIIKLTVLPLDESKTGTKYQAWFETWQFNYESITEGGNFGRVDMNYFCS